jgi:hypothetical protein
LKQPKYIEGTKAQENFEEGMKDLFNVPKDESCKGREEAEEEAVSRPECTQTAPFRQGPRDPVHNLVGILWQPLVSNPEWRGTSSSARVASEG